MMDKNREAFEAWLEDSGNAELCAGSSIGTTIKMLAWEAFRVSWGKSRQAIEVDLKNVNHVQVVEGTFYLSEIEVNEHLTSLGIRVKGNEE